MPSACVCMWVRVFVSVHVICERGYGELVAMCKSGGGGGGGGGGVGGGCSW